MTKARVLVVDDSATIRQLLREVLGSDSELDVAGVAPNGRVALNMLGRLSPDLVTLDLEMPDLDGMETLKCIRDTHPYLPVVVFSGKSEREIEKVLSHLRVGVHDFVVKPTGVGNPNGARQFIREQLIPRIKTLCGIKSALPVLK